MIAALHFSESDIDTWFAQCSSTHSTNTGLITIWSRNKFNKFVKEYASIKGVECNEVIIDDRLVRAFVFCCSFVHKQTITSIRSTLYHGLLRALREDFWTESEVRAFADSYLMAVKQLKVSNKFIPSTKEIDPALKEDLLCICAAIPDCLILKPIVTSVLSLSLSTGARSVTLANIRPGDLVQCIQVTSHTLIQLFSRILPSVLLTSLFLLVISRPLIQNWCYLPSFTALEKVTITGTTK